MCVVFFIILFHFYVSYVCIVHVFHFIYIFNYFITFHVAPSILCIYSTARLQIENKQTKQNKQNKTSYTLHLYDTTRKWGGWGKTYYNPSTHTHTHLHLHHTHTHTHTFKGGSRHAPLPPPLPTSLIGPPVIRQIQSSEHCGHGNHISATKPFPYQTYHTYVCI